MKPSDYRVEHMAGVPWIEVDDIPHHRRIKKLSFYLTCRSYPEQYDVHPSVRRNTQPVGYVRLRRGSLTVDAIRGRPGNADSRAEVLRHHFSDGRDEFEDEAVREKWLKLAAKKIKAYLAKRGNR